MKNVVFSVFLAVLSAALFIPDSAAQTVIEGGAGVVHVSSDPDSDAALQTQSPDEALLAIDNNGGSLYVYDSLAAITLRWLKLNEGVDWIGTFDGQEGSYYLDYNNLTNLPSIPTVDGTAFGPSWDANGDAATKDAIYDELSNVGLDNFDTDVGQLFGIVRGIYLDDPDEWITSDGTTVTLNIEATGGGDIRMLFSDGVFTLDATPTATIALTAGSDVSPTLNYIYIPQSTKVLTVSTTGWPSTEYIAVGTALVQSAASVQTDGVYKFHQWSDHAYKASNNTGHLAHLNYWIRQQAATWTSGVALTPTAGVGQLDITTTSGNILQLHPHAFPAFTTVGATDDIYVINDPDAAYTKVGGLTQAEGVDKDLNGTLLGDPATDFYNLVLWGVVSEDLTDCKLMLNLPDGAYANDNDQQATLDRENTAAYDIPMEYVGTGFLIARLTIQENAGTYTVVNNEDLRGLFPSTAAGDGTGLGQGSEFADNAFRIHDEADISKEVEFQLNGVTTSTLRTLTVPDASGTIALTSDVFTPSTLLADYGFTDNSSNWNTAFGWGDHALAGYLTDAPSDGSEYVRLNGAWAVASGGGGGGPTFGTDNQIPYTNAGGTDYDYSANFTYDGAGLYVGGTDVALDATANIKSSDAKSLKIMNTATSGSSAGAGIVAMSDDGSANVAGDRLGFFLFGGNNGLAIRNAAGIVGYSQSTWNGSNQEAKLVIETSPPNVGNVREEVAEFDYTGLTMGTGNKIVIDGLTLEDGSIYTTAGDLFIQSATGNMELGNIRFDSYQTLGAAQQDFVFDYDNVSGIAAFREFDGDHADIDYTPTFYTPTTAPAEAADADDLAAHLAGVNAAIGGLTPENDAFDATWDGDLDAATKNVIYDYVSTLIAELKDDPTPELAANLIMNGTAFVDTVTLGENASARDLLTLDTDLTDGNYYLTDCDDVSRSTGHLVLALEAGLATEQIQVAILGKVPGFTALSQKPYYISATPGAITDTAPSTEGQVARIVGQGTDTNTIFNFQPASSWAIVQTP